MNASPLSEFGSSRERVLSAVASIRAGNGVLLVDDGDRENEGDLIFAAETLTEAQTAMLIRECSGIVCLCITGEKALALDLPQMVHNNTSGYGTAFTVSIEAAEGVTTGVSAHDRCVTVRTAAGENCRPEDLRRPGHVFPLTAKAGGVLERRGHTEGTVDLMRLAGLSPAGVLCELTNPDGTMAKLSEIILFARRQNITVLSIEDISAFRLEADRQN
ncbi:MAG: 3,4-dihydroxy-2-butanone-4-phosphate synthase [Spirochaetota bacterium]